MRVNMDKILLHFVCLQTYIDKSVEGWRYQVYREQITLIEKFFWFYLVLISYCLIVITIAPTIARRRINEVMINQIG